MMTKEQAEALGKRALAAGWLRTEGALYQRPLGILQPLRIAFGIIGTYPNKLPRVPKGSWPDFRDAATLGILVAMVGALLDNDRLVEVCTVRVRKTRPSAVRWAIADGTVRRIRYSQGWHDDRAHAWVATLEAALPC